MSAFGEPGPNWKTLTPPQPRSEGHLVEFRKQWDHLAQRVSPTDPRPAQAITHFFEFTRDLDRWIREWGAIADAENDTRLRQLIQEAHLSLRDLVQEARAAFEAARQQRVEQQQQADMARWQQQQQQAAHQRQEAEHQARLDATHRDIQDIYSSIRANARRSSERRQAMWNASMYPDTYCVCGKAKLLHHPCCWDCAQHGRTRIY